MTAQCVAHAYTFTLYNVHCSMYNVYCTLYTVQYIVYSVHITRALCVYHRYTFM